MDDVIGCIPFPHVPLVYGCASCINKFSWLPSSGLEVTPVPGDQWSEEPRGRERLALLLRLTVFRSCGTAVESPEFQVLTTN